MDLGMKGHPRASWRFCVSVAILGNTYKHNWHQIERYAVDSSDYQISCIFCLLVK
jgi:hypothetical protein